MSGQVRQPQAEYFGIIDGVVYRISDDNGGRGRLAEPVSLKIQPAASGQDLVASADERPIPPNSVIQLSRPRSSSAIGREAASAKAPINKDRLRLSLFDRDGAESLRAGHPDLWRLLVAGTCLEGSTFKSD
jgi:hypothetical protein